MRLLPPLKRRQKVVIWLAPCRHAGSAICAGRVFSKNLSALPALFAPTPQFLSVLVGDPTGKAAPCMHEVQHVQEVVLRTPLLATLQIVRYIDVMNEITTTSTSDGRDPQSGRFLTGNNGGPGRKTGSRNKLGEAFVADLRADWEQHGPAVIEQVRKAEPAAYLRVVASLMPRQLEADFTVGVFHDATIVLEAFRMASELTGADPDRALQRLRRHAPHLIDHDDG
jgi:hypothetical protein